MISKISFTCILPFGRKGNGWTDNYLQESLQIKMQFWESPVIQHLFLQSKTTCNQGKEVTTKRINHENSNWDNIYQDLSP